MHYVNKILGFTHFEKCVGEVLTWKSEIPRMLLEMTVISGRCCVDIPDLWPCLKPGQIAGLHVTVLTSPPL